MKISKIIKLIPCFIIPLIIFLINFFILVPLNIYISYPWLDIPMHFLGGSVIAISSICVLKRCRDEIIIKDEFVKIIIIIALVSLVATCWEFWEFFEYNTIDVKDTLFDLFMGLLGGLSVSILNLLLYRGKKSL